MTQENPNQPQVKASIGLIIAGYIFAILGGLIGVAIGSNLKNAKHPSPNGTKVLKYDATSRTHGTAILVISCLMMAAAFAINIALQ